MPIESGSGTNSLKESHGWSKRTCFWIGKDMIFCDEGPKEKKGKEKRKDSKVVCNYIAGSLKPFEPAIQLRNNETENIKTKQRKR